MKVSEKAYIAGLFDGEGAIVISPYSNGWFSMQVAITQYKSDVLKIIKKRFGGRITNEDRTWSISGKEAMKMLMKIYPFLIVKKPQAHLGIAFQHVQDLTTKWKHSKKAGALRNRELSTPSDIEFFYCQCVVLMRKLNKTPSPATETERERLVIWGKQLHNKYATVQTTRIVNS